MTSRQQREQAILSRLAADGSVTVSALSAELGVSEVTIRSQLTELELQGQLVRVHGGARPVLSPTIVERQQEHEAAKRRIARAAVGLIADNDRIMIEAGTTTALIAKHLAGRHVQVVTNSTLLFTYARQNTALDVVLTGGAFHRRSESLIGPMALRAISELNVRLAFVGTDGFTVERGITTEFFEGAQVQTAMAARAEETWLVADSSKHGRAGFVSALPLSGLAGIITDSGISEPDLARLREHVPDVRVV